MRPVAPSRVSQPFADPGNYASRADTHGPAGHHTGIDYGSAWPLPINGRTIRAVLPGQVVINEWNSWAGNWVGIYNHDRDLLVTYWHMAARSPIPVGQWVQVFAPVGKVGSSGNSTAPHLHLQVNPGPRFDYHGHVPPQAALSAYSRRQARAIYRRQPTHPAAAW